MFPDTATLCFSLKVDIYFTGRVQLLIADQVAGMQHLYSGMRTSRKNLYICD
jgi:hypothetical protein